MDSKPEIHVYIYIHVYRTIYACWIKPYVYIMCIHIYICVYIYIYIFVQICLSNLPAIGEMGFAPLVSLKCGNIGWSFLCFLSGKCGSLSKGIEPAPTEQPF